MIRRKLFPVGLFSILAFVGAFAVATDALACKFTTGASHYCSTTRTTGTWAGSFIGGVLTFGDIKAHLHDAAPGFFDAEWFTPTNQSFKCMYDKHPALCATAITCEGFKISTDCTQGGELVHQMVCPVTAGSPGCSGFVRVTLTDGSVFQPPFNPPDDPKFPATKTFSFTAEDVADNECNKKFPRINKGLTQGVIGEIATSCTQAPFDISDNVRRMSVRGALDPDPSRTYAESSGPWVAEVLCESLPQDGYPTGSCTNDSGAWHKILNNPEFPAPVVNAELCVEQAKQLTCGDQIDAKGNIVPGPAPIEAQLHDGACRVRCARCNKAGSLVNLGNGINGTFVVADSKGVSGTKPWAAICPITIKGN